MTCHSVFESGGDRLTADQVTHVLKSEELLPTYYEQLLLNM